MNTGHAVGDRAGVSPIGLHPRRGPHDPTAGVPARRPGSVRRTSTVDSVRGADLLGPVAIIAAARDVVTQPDGSAAAVAQCEMTAEIAFAAGRQLTAISARPHDPRLTQLIGARASSGFRARAEAALDQPGDNTSLLHLLLDDLPVATLVGGYALSAAASRDHEFAAKFYRGPHAGTPDLCAGWRSGGTIMIDIESSGRVPVVTGPLAPSISNPDDPQAWHAQPELPPHAMRRARLLDLWPAGDRLAVHSLFRDSHVDGEGRQTVVHEYTVEATIDAARLVVLECRATPRVLPWLECPAAAASTQRLAGRHVSRLRAEVRSEFTGTSTCTHLNDQLRSLADIPALLRLLR